MICSEESKEVPAPTEAPAPTPDPTEAPAPTETASPAAGGSPAAPDAPQNSFTEVSGGSGFPWLPVGLVAAVVIVALIVLRDPGRDISQESAVAIKDAVERCARQCYVVEGVYPPNLAYLEDHYGIRINKKDYFVNYDAFASNVPPSVIVTPVGSTRASEALP